MDVVFTISVWLVLVTLIAHGLRLAQLDRDEADAQASAVAAVPAPAAASAERARELVGAGPTA